MAQITCRDLTVGYEGNPVAKGINFQAQAGDYLSIVGENGSGKSTLMKTLLGLIKPLEGEIVFGDGLKRGDIGYLPQQTHAQRDFPASVWEVVMSGCLSGLGFRPFYGAKERARAAAGIEKMGLKGFEKRSYRELSGGQQQRVLLARALCATRKILLLDEPVSGLDPLACEELYKLVKTVNSEGTTVIMISHDISAALAYSDKILHVGANTFFGGREEYLQSGVSGAFAREGAFDREGEFAVGTGAAAGFNAASNDFAPRGEIK